MASRDRWDGALTDEQLQAMSPDLRSRVLAARAEQQELEDSLCRAQGFAGSVFAREDDPEDDDDDTF